MIDFAPIPVTRFDALLSPVRAWSLGPMPEVTLRGAWGAAIYDVACLDDDRDCATCERVERCVIPEWFERGRGGDELRPFVLEVDPPAGTISSKTPLRFGVWLFGEIPRPSLLLYAVARMAARGLGVHRVEHRVGRLEARGEGAPVAVVADDREIGRWPSPSVLGRMLRRPANARPARLHLLTPTRLPSPGAKPRPRDVLRAAVQRLRALERATGVSSAYRWPEAEEDFGEWEHLEQIEAERWSQRSQGVQDLSGWVGTLALGPAAEPFAELLAAAEVMHLGGGTSAGCGRVEVEWRGGRVEVG